jgi:hypothetical protein
MLGAGGVDEAGGLVTVDDLIKSAMEEGILNVELASLPVKGERDGEDDANRSQVDNWVEHLVEVDALLLGKAVKHPSCFVEVEEDIRLDLGGQQQKLTVECTTTTSNIWRINFVDCTSSLS